MSLAAAGTDDAQETFMYTVNQIEAKWDMQSAEKFVKDALKTLNTIATRACLFKASFSKNIRQAFISK